MEEQHYLDDTSIAGSASLWRRIPPRHFTLDEETGRLRPSSAAFEDHPTGTPMSVVLGDDVLAAGRHPSSVIEGHDAYGVASLTAGFVRTLKQGVVREPLDEEPAHAVVFGKKTKGVRSKMAKSSIWVIAPSTIEEPVPTTETAVTDDPPIARIKRRRVSKVWLTAVILALLIVAILLLVARID